jgi:hypothetical protein
MLRLQDDPPWYHGGRFLKKVLIFEKKGGCGGPSYRRSHHLLYRTLEGRVVVCGKLFDRTLS